MMSHKQQQRLLYHMRFRGMTRHEVTELLGDGSYDADTDVWHYTVHITFWGRKTIFIIGYRSDNTVEFKLTKYTY
ncbi:hypothetical protein ACR1PO_03215 [Chryseobacterium sp. RRHN12]|uniref:hypothetical protein n=1 Tax=Chryseobacterium sp. RRHN12 TaxID=3437884 RepID=UPI003D9B9D3F